MAIVSNGAAECNTFLPPALPRPRRHATGTEVSVMEVLQDGVLAFLAATGAAALFWLLTGWLRRRSLPG